MQGMHVVLPTTLPVHIWGSKGLRSSMQPHADSYAASNFTWIYLYYRNNSSQLLYPYVWGIVHGIIYAAITCCLTPGAPCWRDLSAYTLLGYGSPTRAGPSEHRNLRSVCGQWPGQAWQRPQGERALGPSLFTFKLQLEEGLATSSFPSFPEQWQLTVTL